MEVLRTKEKELNNTIIFNVGTKTLKDILSKKPVYQIQMVPENGDKTYWQITLQKSKNQNLYKLDSESIQLLLIPKYALKYFLEKQRNNGIIDSPSFLEAFVLIEKDLKAYNKEFNTDVRGAGWVSEKEKITFEKRNQKIIKSTFVKMNIIGIKLIQNKKTNHYFPLP
ncbi:hypothetical protein MUP35_00075 [Patescibacteria group bacterium]|nr:hypothetical protein [Patescibacteria group bacterium]